MNLKKIFSIIATSWLLVFLNPVLADCVPSTRTPIIIFPDMTVQADAAVGTVLATASTSYTITCNRDGITNVNDYTWLIYLSAANYSAGGPINGLSNVVPTGIPGIGMRWTNWTSNVGNSVMTTTRLNDTTKARGIPASNGDGTTTSLKDTVELIKTGPINAGTQSISINRIAMWRKTQLNSLNPSGDLYSIMFTPFNLINASCDIEDSNINVNLGTVTKNQFSGVGTTTNTVNFSINLTCIEGTRVNLTLSNLNALAGFTGTIKLDGANAATGVGIQIVDETNTPVPLGASRLITSSSSANVSILLGARYIQTAANITAGPANGVLVFTVNYL